MSIPKRPEQVLPDEPVYRPLERFWPYAELSEQPSEEELAALHPELRSALFGAESLPFSISLVFSPFEGSNYARALELARGANEYSETSVNGGLRHRARFYPGDRPSRLHELYDLVGYQHNCEVLVDDQPVPYARELWLLLVWFLER